MAEYKAEEILMIEPGSEFVTETKSVKVKSESSAKSGNRMAAAVFVGTVARIAGNVKRRLGSHRSRGNSPRSCG